MGTEETTCERIASVILRMKRFFPAVLLASAALAAPSAHAVSKTEAAEQAGAVLFRDKGCAYCHGVGGIGSSKAPSLTGLREDKLWTPAKIVDQILNGGQKMPAFRESLSDEEAAELAAYLRARHRPIPPSAPPR